MSKKKRIIYVAIASAIIVIAALAIIFMPKTAAPQTVTEMLSTAQKYLVEMEYERAIAEFNKVIELDPMNADAYLGLAEAYEKLADVTLKNGYELTGDDRLQSKLALLNGENMDNAEVSETETAIDETTTDEETTSDKITEEEVNSETVSAETTLFEETSATEQVPIADTEDFIVIKGERYSTDLTELDLLGKDLTDEDIKDIYKMKKLTKLTLNSNQISDLSVISSLTNLTYLDLLCNQITDISEISNLTNLTELYLGENQISDISALSELTNLTILYLGDNQISDISGLSKLTNLTWLALYDNQISDISALSGLTNLKEIYLSNNLITREDALTLKTALPNCDIMY